jgi:uncharacterized membrane protein
VIASLWLAHHRGEGLSRCFDLGGIRVCARCSGLLPALFAAMIAEFLWPLSMPSRFVLAGEVLLLVPGFWSVLGSALRNESNRVRFVTGAGLGLALGHAAMIGHRRGFGEPEALMPLLASVAASLWLVDRVWRSWQHQRASS